MNIISRLHGKSGNSIGRLLTTGVSVWLLGVAFTPALAATQSPAIEQAPLIIQQPLPPNIVLMLDDSGSMKANFMPDFCYLNGVDCSGWNETADNDALINANNNGVYYNPTVTYSPPPTADSTADAPKSFANQTDITSVPVDGFASTLNKVDLTTYDGGYECNSGDQCGLDYSKIDFNASTGSWDSRKYYFQYSTGAAAGPYAVHYVAASSCGTLTTTSTPSCVLASDTSGAAAPSGVAAGENIANWFAYYHTRLLMAKSGLMNAFSAIDPAFRVGFGSINGNNDRNLPALKGKYGGDGDYIAKVVPFGDGATGTQKASFWSWVQSATGGNSTPLRGALNEVGSYYQDSQPWQTSSTDTTELACRQSYTILTTDGFWRTESISVGNVDNESATLAGPNGTSYTYTPAPPYSDSNSNTLADVAMKYWVTDLRPTSNEVPTSKDDPAFWQHMVTFTLGMGFSPTNISGDSTSDDDIFAWANGGSAIANFSWPVPSDNNINNIADLEHAAVNGHGGFASAKTPGEFSQALKKALQRASDRVGTGASLAANSTQLKTGAFAYQANYFTGNWKGDLKAIAVNPNNGTLATTPTWTASSELPAAADRKIYTYNPDTAAAVEFKTVAVLSADEKTALGSDATAQLDMIDYLRGDHSKEIGQTDGTYRTRETPLGDIVDSQPVYSGQPDANQFVGQSFTGKDSYEAHAAKTRSGLIFVAANDGMLHAFYTDTVTADGTVAGSSSVASASSVDVADTSSVAGASSVAVVDTIAGAEAYAYLPAAVITTNTSATTPARSTSDLTTLADPDYGTTTSVPHQFFNDGELTVADAYFGSAWHTVAVGTTGRGLAKAIYALDVTDPTSISVLWERSAGDGKANADYIGQMIGKPVIAQTTDAGTSDPTGDSNWSVLIGNGYNSTKGTAALLQFNLADGTLSVHKTDDAITGNGLAAPAVWIGDLSVGISTVAFAGDLKGNVWSFSLNTAKTVKVKGEDVTTYTANLTSTGTTLFIAKDKDGKVQPITAGMLVGKNPVTQDLWLFFGTGQYLSNSDLKTTTTQSWYGLIAQVGTGSDSTAVTSATTRTSTTTKLKQRSIIAETEGTDAVLNDDDGTIETAAIAPARAVTELPTTSDMAGMSGWYIDLLAPTSSTSTEQDPDFPDDPSKTIEVTTYTPNAVAQGERIVTPSQFQGNQLLATTRIPEAADLCNPSGRGWIMAVDPFTGTNPKSSFFDLNGDGQINQPADYIMVNGKPVATSGIGFSSLPNNPIFMGGTMLVSFDNGSAASIKTSGTSNTLQRVSWRELIAQ